MRIKVLYGVNMKFDKKKHTYTNDGIKYTPVTEFIHSFFKPFDAKFMAKMLAKKRRANGEDITAWDLKREWKLSQTNGSKLHKYIEQYVQGKKLKIKEDFTYKQKVYTAITVVEQLKRDGYTLVPEMILHDDKTRIAGTVDLVAIKDKTVVIVDWKTNKTLYMSGTKNKQLKLDDCNFVHYTLQLSLYAFLLEKLGYKINELMLVHLSTPTKIYTVEYMKDKIEEMIKIWEQKLK